MAQLPPRRSTRRLRLVRNGGIGPILVDDATGQVIEGQRRIDVRSDPSEMGVCVVELLTIDMTFLEDADTDALSGWERLCQHRAQIDVRPSFRP